VKEKRQGSPQQKPTLQGNTHSEEQGRGQKEKITNNSLISSIEQKLSDQLNPPPAGEKKTEGISLLAQKLSDEFKSNITPEDIESVSRPPERRPTGVSHCSLVPPVMFSHKIIERLVEDEFFSEVEASWLRQLPDDVFTLDETRRLVQWLGELCKSRDSEK
jgi:hypothetical protein